MSPVSNVRYHVLPLTCLLLGSYDHTVKMYDSRTDQCVLDVNHGCPVESVLVFPTASLLLSAGEMLLKQDLCLSLLCRVSSDLVRVESIASDSSAQRGDLRSNHFKLTEKLFISRSCFLALRGVGKARSQGCIRGQYPKICFVSPKFCYVQKSFLSDIKQKLCFPETYFISPKP